MSQPYLNYTQLAPRDESLDLSRTPWLVCLHGILGRGRNWQGMARRIQRAYPQLGVILPDLRHHGRSFKPEGTHALDDVASDVARLLEHLDVQPFACLGHSYGAKVALMLSQQLLVKSQAHALKGLWLMDSSPAAQCTPADTSLSRDVVNLLKQSPRYFDSTAEFVAYLESQGLASSTAQWLAMNLVREDVGRYRLSIDVEAIEVMLAVFFDTDLWPALTGMKQIRRFVINGARSSAYSDADNRKLEDLCQQDLWVDYARIPEAGHWLHAEQPELTANEIIRQMSLIL